MPGKISAVENIHRVFVSVREIPSEKFPGGCFKTVSLLVIFSRLETGFTKKSLRNFGGFPGADDEIRTRDLNLGKVALYQLSYICMFVVGVSFNPFL